MEDAEEEGHGAGTDGLLLGLGKVLPDKEAPRSVLRLQ